MYSTQWLSVGYVPSGGDVLSAGLTVLNSKISWKKAKVAMR